jgi:hypothetical protein
MATCEICGTEFDEHGVQIVVPGLAKSFDRIDCAARARAIAGPSARNVASAPAVFVDVAPASQPRAYGLPGLPAGLAAALAAARARLALGGASVAVVLLVTGTVHLASRIGSGDSDPAAGASPLSPAPRHADDFLFRAAAPEASSPRPAFDRARQHADGVQLIANRSLDDVRRTTRASADARRRTGAGGSVSTRPGWGWGDKNHTHGGPRQSSGAALGKSRHPRK